MCGQGDLCFRLQHDFSKFVAETSDESNDTAEAAVEVYNTIRPHSSSSGEIQPPRQNSSSGSLPLSQVFAATNDDVKPGPSSMVDLMCTSPGNTPLDDNELPPVVFSKQPAVSTDTLCAVGRCCCQSL